MDLAWPLMKDNVSREDLDVLIRFLQGMPRLTQGENVRAFEAEWSKWLGVRHSVYVNSGASANLITMAALRQTAGPGEVIVPALTWVSDLVSVLAHGFTPVFVDANPRTLCMAEAGILARLSPRTRAVFMTHVQGFNGLTDRLLAELQERRIPLIEDVCEAHGATFHGRHLGTFGLAANFSFYFAHHMTTVEGGMVSTDDDEIHELVRMFRSHGLVREADSPACRERYAREFPDLSPEFIFAVPGYNVRGTELGAVIGRHQLGRLDTNNRRRQHNLDVFLAHLDPALYRTDFDVEGSCSYAFNLVLSQPDTARRDRLEQAMRQAGIEFRRGSSGGGNQLRQPYLRGVVADGSWTAFPEVEHIHFFGYYIGNHPALEDDQIVALCRFLNAVR